MARNEEYWNDIYDTMDEYELDHNANIQQWLELLEHEGKLRQIDLMRINNLLKAVIQHMANRSK